ncbi:MAG: sugar phosphate isomerase/epimerase [Bacteroidota bacterium]
MKIDFFCPRWGCEDLSWKVFFNKVKEAGYDGVEIGFSSDLRDDEKKEIVDGLAQYKLKCIGQHWQTTDHDFKLHQSNFARELYSLSMLNPLFINSQTGKDHFTEEQNIVLIDLADKIGEETGVKIVHETHRGKWSFAAHVTERFLKKYPSVRITLDISHWCNVAESFLADQRSAVIRAILHTDHIHARVGYPEGPQVPDPREPLWDEALQHHLKWWDEVVSTKRDQGSSYFTITPEFGAPPYTVLLPGTNKAIANQWDINLFMKDMLKDRYRLFAIADRS